jgi:hypothetical protein
MRSPLVTHSASRQDEQDPPAADRMNDSFIPSAQPILPILTGSLTTLRGQSP